MKQESEIAIEYGKMCRPRPHSARDVENFPFQICDVSTCVLCGVGRQISIFDGSRERN